MELRVALVAGLHVEARRATVERLLTTTPDSVTLHHDLSTAPKGTVLRTLRDTSGVLSSGEAPLVNDCACCALREDLLPELERLADAGLTRLAIVELWDSVEPKAMAEVIACGGFEVSAVITAVDPAPPLPPRAALRRPGRPPARPPAAADASGSPTGPTPCSPGTQRAAHCAWRTPAPGSLHCPTPPGASSPPLRRAAAALDWHPEHGDRCQHLVFTSPGLDRDGLQHTLNSCLLNDREYAAGRTTWKHLHSAFDTLLET